MIKYTSFIDKVFSDLVNDDRNIRGRAARHVTKKIRAKISSKDVSAPGAAPGMDTGELRKAIRFSNKRTVSLVGVRTPDRNVAIQGLALEFGSYKMAPRPYLFPTFAEEAPAVKSILREERLK